jgi:hypothetical protein
MIYNANLDKSIAQRRSLTELRGELKKWEEVQKADVKKREKERVVGDDAARYQVRLCELWGRIFGYVY